MRDQITPYCGPAPDPAALWRAWNIDPWLLAALAVLLLAGLRFSRARQVFFAGWLVLALAFVSPLCALSTALFSARTLHHLLLLTVAAPLLAWALPLARLPPAVGLASALASLVAWHLPQVYGAAWDSAGVYWLLQGVLLLSALGFWGAVLHGGAGLGARFGALVGLAAGMGLIGAVLTFAPGVLYVEHLATTALWGLEPLADQQLAGLVMWVPGLVPLAVPLALLARRAWAAEVAV